MILRFRYGLIFASLLDLEFHSLHYYLSVETPVVEK